MYSRGGKFPPWEILKSPPPKFWQREKFGQLILARIIEIVATRCQILRLKFDFGWSSAQDPAVGAYSVPPDSLTAFEGPTSRGREGFEGKGREGQGRGGDRRGREGMERDGRFPRLF